MLKPSADILLFSYQLYKSLGPLASAGLWSNYIFTAILLRKLSPPFGKMKAVEGRREGEFRGLHARLIANAEEVAFYGGADMERVFLDKGWSQLKKWMESIYTLKIRYNILEDFVLKYSWSAYGYLLTSLPVFLPAWGGMGGLLELSSENDGRERGRMKEFITNKRLMPFDVLVERPIRVGRIYESCLYSYIYTSSGGCKRILSTQRHSPRTVLAFRCTRYYSERI
jgi:ATP-binding cassette subfamily D (ALD) long-chain fatty acid import protein